MTLWEINQQLRNVIDTGAYLVNTETGEKFTPEALDALEIAREEKIEGICVVIKEKFAMADALKAEMKALNERQKALISSANWLKDYLQEQLHGEKFESPKAKVSYRNSKAVVFTDWTQVPKEFLKAKEITEADLNKMEISKVLKAGLPVPGAALEDRMAVIIK